MILPRINEETGRPYISYSQYRSWNEDQSFNLKIEGAMEYILSYFFGREFPDEGWGEFGQDVEDYICLRENGHKFTQEEKDVLETIKPLGKYQIEGYINMGDFDVKLYIDDATPDLSKIRDYKTASKNSAKRYYSDDYLQLDLYAMWVLQQTGKIPELEVCIIERAGNCMFGRGRKALSVKGEVWYHTRKTSKKKLKEIEKSFKETAQEISEYYQIYQKMNK